MFRSQNDANLSSPYLPNIHPTMIPNSLPSHWQIKKLGEVCDSIQYGYTESSSKENIGPKFLRITDIQDNRVLWEDVPHCKIEENQISKYLLKDGDLLFARTGATVGKSFLIKGKIPKSVFASYLIRVRVGNEVFDKFISFYFHSNSYWSQITEGQVGIGQPNVNGTKLSNLYIPLPPLPEQEAIVAKIESLFAELEAGKSALLAAREQIKLYRQSLLKAAFEGKLTEKSKKPLETGQLPEGWKWVKLGEVCKTTSGGTPYRGNVKFYNGTIPWIKSGELDKGLILDSEEKITEEAVENSSAKIFPKGTLLFALYGATIGKMAFLGIEAATNQAICGIFENENISLKFLFQYLTLIKKNLISQGIGGAQPNISQTILKNTELPLPPLSTQEKIVAILEEKLGECDALDATIEKSLTDAELLRQSILKEAFEGRLVKMESIKN